MIKLYDHDPNHPDHGGFYARWCNLIRPLATPVLPSFREYPFSEFSDPFVLQALSWLASVSAEETLAGVLYVG
jgi:hypothetical protein